MTMERLFLKMADLVRHPPSRQRILIWLVVIGLCLALAGIEWLGFWPQGLRMNSSGLPHRF
ncbi:MAG: hypothetical protein ORN49_00745 [Rhodobacteraceae bacterium]|nr:hypothetical protein [Paracoccaceae bacterium]